MIATVVTVAGLCDALRDDTGLVAAIAMGIVLANLRGVDLPEDRPFLETVVQLAIGVLFISISATVTPASLRGVIWPTLGLVALLVLLVRPAVAAVATMRTSLPRNERIFIGFMDPRGIVAASTAASFSAPLVALHIGGANKLLAATFLVIVGTVAIYGLAATPVAKALGLREPEPEKSPAKQPPEPTRDRQRASRPKYGHLDRAITWTASAPASSEERVTGRPRSDPSASSKGDATGDPVGPGIPDPGASASGDTPSRSATVDNPGPLKRLPATETAHPVRVTRGHPPEEFD